MILRQLLSLKTATKMVTMDKPALDKTKGARAALDKTALAVMVHPEEDLVGLEEVEEDRLHHPLKKKVTLRRCSEKSQNLLF